MHQSNEMAQEEPKGVPARKSRSAQTNFQLEGVWLHLARGTWIALLLMEVVAIILSLPAAYGQGLIICPFIVVCTVTPETAHALHSLSIASASYTTYNFALALLQSLVFLCVGGFIFWRKSNEPIALAASYFFVSIGLSPFVQSTTLPLEVVFSSIGGLSIFTALGYFLVTFPDGRFVPSWSWLLVVLWFLQAIFNVISGPYNINSWPPPLSAALEVLTYGGTLGVLIYRYVRVFSYSQRQQAKWLVFGFGALFALIILYDIIGSLVPGLGAPDSLYQLANGTLTTVVFLFVPLSVAIAILRSRLWDIDVIIRRTLVYTILTMILALMYVCLVFFIGTMLRGLFGQQQNPVVIVASTLVIAALFQPLRHGLQKLIDRRFYRSKYDAAKTLKDFSETLRGEIDLEELSKQLVTVVQETMQPSSVSLWLRKPERNTSSSDQKPLE